MVTVMDTSVIAAGVGAGVGLLNGWLIGRLGRNKSRPKGIPRPAHAATCACGHPRSMHVRGVELCQEKVYIHVTQQEGSHFAKCGCQLYDGPEPMPSYYAPEIDGGTD